jgi:hypothetical protein
MVLPINEFRYPMPVSRALSNETELEGRKEKRRVGKEKSGKREEWEKEAMGRYSKGVGRGSEERGRESLPI